MVHGDRMDGDYMSDRLVPWQGERRGRADRGGFPQVLATTSTVTLVIRAFRIVLTWSGGQGRSWHCQHDVGILSFLVSCCCGLSIKTGLSLTLLSQFNYLWISAHCPWRYHWENLFCCSLYFLISSLWTELQKAKQGNYVVCRGVSLKSNNTAVKIMFCSASVYTADYRVGRRCLNLFSVFLHNTGGYTMDILTWNHNVKSEHGFITKKGTIVFLFSNSALFWLPCWLTHRLKAFWIFFFSVDPIPVLFWLIGMWVFIFISSMEESCHQNLKQSSKVFADV